MLINLRNHIFLFFLFFGFKTPFLNSGYLAGFLAGFILLFDLKARKYFIKLLLNKYVLNILILSLILVLISFLTVYFHGSKDFSLVKQLLGQFPTYIFSLMVFSVIFPYVETETALLKLICVTFFLQSIVIIIAFASPFFLSIVENFQYENTEKAGDLRDINIFRGLSLSGDLFFGLSACYGLIYIFFMKYILDIKKLNWIDIFIGLLLFVGNFFVGRTGFLGVIFALIFAFFYKSDRLKIKRLFKGLLITIYIIIFVVLLLPTDLKVLIVDNVLPFAFELAYNYFEDEGLETESTNHLLSMYEVSMNTNTFLFGDGFFTSIYGNYYKSTDSGYLRHLFFGGVFYLLFNIIYQFKLFSIKQFKNNLTKKKLYNMNLLIVIFCLYFLILHFKGLTIGYMRTILIITFCYYSFLNINKQKI